MKLKISQTSLRKIIQEELLNEMPRRKTSSLESTINTLIELLDEILDADHLDDIEGTEALIKGIGSRIGAMYDLISKAKTRRTRAQWTPEKRAEIARKRAATVRRRQESEKKLRQDREVLNKARKKRAAEIRKLRVGAKLEPNDFESSQQFLSDEERSQWKRVYNSFYDPRRGGYDAYGVKNDPEYDQKEYYYVRK